MIADRIAAATAFLLGQRATDAVLTAELPENLRPHDAAEARAVQLALLERLGPIGGWKVGRSDTGELMASPLPVSGVKPSPATLVSRRRGVECEIGFTFATPLPTRPEPYVEADILAAIGSCQATMEIVDPRFIDHAAVDPLTALADLGFHGALAVGAPVAAWTPELFAGLAVTLSIDGIVAKRIVSGPDTPRFLVGLLIGLANSEIVQAAGGIEPGAVVTTGSWTGLDFVPAGGLAVAQFDGFPAVEVSFA